MIQHNSAQQRPGKSSFAVVISLVAMAYWLLAGTPVLAATACCVVADIGANGQVTAREINGTRTIGFQVSDAALLRGLRPGAPVYANFDTKQVSLDGMKACCKILQISAASKPVTPSSTPAASAATTPLVSPPLSVPDRTAQMSLLEITQRANMAPPLLTFGTLRNVQTDDWRDGTQRLLQYQNTNMIRLRGDKDIKRASGLPQAAKDVLWLHARTLEAQELDEYIVIPEEAQKWASTLPESVREKLRKAASDDGRKKNKGCSTKYISTGCLKNEVSQAIDDVTNTARKAWGDIEAEWGLLIDNVQDAQQCFADKTLKAKIPVKFSTSPFIPVSFSESTSTSNKSGGASGNVSGSIVVEVPVTVDALVDLQVFYIPCVPFAIRPRSIGADGTLDAGGNFFANVTANGEFTQLFTIPPAGGIQIPFAVLPIVLAGVPIAVLDISVYLDGTLRVDGNGKLEGNLALRSMQKSAFDFECSGHGCELEKRSVPVPATAVESVQLDGRIRIKPAIYAALQLGLNFNLLNARAGPQPYLLGQILGCGAAMAAQNTSGASSSENWYALAADLDWGLELRAEALAGGQKVAQKTWSLKEEHIYFKDLVSSTAFIPSIASKSQPKLGQPAAFTMKMPNCYLYPDSMKYQVNWTGGASANTNATSSTGRTAGARPTIAAGTTIEPSTCTVATGQASCQGAPMNDTVINLSWPAAGNYTLTVTPQIDAHGRRFDASRAAALDINVLP